MFTKRSWESFYSGLIMVGLVFMVFPVIYFCGATKEKQILPPLIMFLLGLVIFVISVHFSVKYHKEKTKYTKYKIDKSLTYTFTLTYGDKVETVTDFSQIEYAIKWLAKYRTGHVEIAVTPTMGSLKKFYICYTDKDPYIHSSIKQMTLLSLLTAAIWTRAEGLAIMLMARGLFNTALMSLSNSAARCSRIVGMAFNV